VCLCVCVCVYVCAFIPLKDLNLLCNWILKQGNKTEWSTPWGIFDIWRELGCLWDSTLSIWILIPLSLSILCVCVCATFHHFLGSTLCVYYILYSTVHSLARVYSCVLVCVSVPHRSCGGGKVCDLHRPSAARLWANNAAAGPAGPPVCRPLCAAPPACCSSLLPDPLTSSWANEQVGRLSLGGGGLCSSWALPSGSRWWHLSPPVNNCEGGSSVWMFYSHNHRRQRVNMQNHKSLHTQTYRVEPHE